MTHWISPTSQSATSRTHSPWVEMYYSRPRHELHPLMQRYMERQHGQKELHRKANRIEPKLGAPLSMSPGDSASTHFPSPHVSRGQEPLAVFSTPVRTPGLSPFPGSEQEGQQTFTDGIVEVKLVEDGVAEHGARHVHNLIRGFEERNANTPRDAAETPRIDRGAPKGGATPLGASPRQTPRGKYLKNLLGKLRSQIDQFVPDHRDYCKRIVASPRGNMEVRACQQIPFQCDDRNMMNKHIHADIEENAKMCTKIANLVQLSTEVTSQRDGPLTSLPCTAGYRKEAGEGYGDIYGEDTKEEASTKGEVGPFHNPGGATHSVPRTLPWNGENDVQMHGDGVLLGIKIDLGPHFSPTTSSMTASSPFPDSPFALNNQVSDGVDVAVRSDHPRDGRSPVPSALFGTLSLDLGSVSVPDLQISTQRSCEDAPINVDVLAVGRAVSPVPSPPPTVGSWTQGHDKWLDDVKLAQISQAGLQDFSRLEQSQKACALLKCAPLHQASPSPDVVRAATPAATPVKTMTRELQPLHKPDHSHIDRMVQERIASAETLSKVAARTAQIIRNTILGSPLTPAGDEPTSGAPGRTRRASPALTEVRAASSTGTSTRADQRSVTPNGPATRIFIASDCQPQVSGRQVSFSQPPPTNSLNLRYSPNVKVRSLFSSHQGTNHKGLSVDTPVYGSQQKKVTAAKPSFECPQSETNILSSHGNINHTSSLISSIQRETNSLLSHATRSATPSAHATFSEIRAVRTELQGNHPAPSPHHYGQTSPAFLTKDVEMTAWKRQVEGCERGLSECLSRIATAVASEDLERIQQLAEEVKRLKTKRDALNANQSPAFTNQRLPRSADFSGQATMPRDYAQMRAVRRPPVPHGMISSIDMQGTDITEKLQQSGVRHLVAAGGCCDIRLRSGPQQGSQPYRQAQSQYHPGEGEDFQHRRATHGIHIVHPAGVANRMSPHRRVIVEGGHTSWHSHMDPRQSPVFRTADVHRNVNNFHSTRDSLAYM